MVASLSSLYGNAASRLGRCYGPAVTPVTESQDGPGPGGFEVESPARRRAAGRRPRDRITGMMITGMIMITAVTVRGPGPGSESSWHHWHRVSLGHPMIMMASDPIIG